MKALNDIFEKIPQYYKNKEYNILIQLLLEIEKSNDINPKLFFELGKVYFVTENYEKAEKYLIKALDFHEFKIFSLDLLCKIYRKKNDIKRIIICCENILDIDDKNINAYIELVNIFFYDKKQYDVALKYANKLIAIKKDDIYINIIKIKIYVLLKKSQDEIKNECDKLLKFIDNNRHLLNELLDMCSFFVVNKECCFSIYIINFIKKYSEIKKTDILSFFSIFQYDFADFFKNIRYSGKDVDKTLNSFLEQVPEYVIKIRNMIINELEIFHKDIVLQSKPRSITVVLTNRCNLRCKMCRVWENTWEMSDGNIEEIKKVMPYLEYVTWHGGEVFLHKRFLELFDFAQECNIQQEVITNGLLLDKNIIEKMIDYGIQLTISIDGINKVIYEKIRKGASFEKLKSNLGKIREYRYKNENSKKIFKIRMNTIISNDNYLDLFNFIEFAHEYNIQEIYFFPLVFDINNNSQLNKFVDLYIPVIEYIEENKTKMTNLSKKYNINIINTIPNSKVFNDKIKISYDKKQKLFDLENDSECSRYNQNEQMIKYEKKVLNIKNSQVVCTVPWQRLRLDKVIRPHCFCKGNVNIGIMDDNFKIDKLWNCEYIQAYRKMIVNKDFNDFCNPSCYLGVIPNEQYNGIV